jgi:hypothetical protein
MTAPRTQFDRFYSRIKNHPLVAFLLVLGTIIIALSILTDAAKNLLGLVRQEKRPAINGKWQATVTYDWPNAKYAETFTFGGDGEELQGTASFLERKRGILEGQVKKDQILFITKTQEVLGVEENINENIHRYKGKIFRDEIKFIMQTEGGYSEHIPIEFTAKRVSDSSLQAPHLSGQISLANSNNEYLSFLRLLIPLSR